MTTMDIQKQSRFFDLPPELRYIIFAYIIPSGAHVCHQEGKFAISTCLWNEETECQGGSKLRGRTRSDNQQYALRSLWGPHWQCEEAARNGSGLRYTHIGYELLGVCMRMRKDILIWMAGNDVYNVIDLDTLDRAAHGGPLHITDPSLRKPNLTKHNSSHFFEDLRCVPMASYDSEAAIQSFDSDRDEDEVDVSKSLFPFD
ncbi:hypothetical protein GGR53DRAFT_468584 [Hypoxylon sp. FL1150]|nr:hypothetical protein GGR53DRAFT_468584 [Hypoxylon sp. FL1150]